jgi:hypothetical protein
VGLPSSAETVASHHTLISLPFGKALNIYKMEIVKKLDPEGVSDLALAAEIPKLNKVVSRLHITFELAFIRLCRTLFFHVSGTEYDGSVSVFLFRTLSDNDVLIELDYRDRSKRSPFIENLGHTDFCPDQPDHLVPL